MRTEQERGRDEASSGARAKTDGSGQGLCGHRPALPYQCRADENLVRLQGGGGCTAAPAIPTRHERREKLKSNRNGQGNFHSHHSIGIVASHSAVPFPYLR